jgi:hypothetical protein
MKEIKNKLIYIYKLIDLFLYIIFKFSNPNLQYQIIKISKIKKLTKIKLK